MVQHVKYFGLYHGRISWINWMRSLIGMALLISMFKLYILGIHLFSDNGKLWLICAEFVWLSCACYGHLLFYSSDIGLFIPCICTNLWRRIFDSCGVYWQICCYFIQIHRCVVIRKAHLVLALSLLWSFRLAMLSIVWSNGGNVLRTWLAVLFSLFV